MRENLAIIGALVGPWIASQLSLAEPFVLRLGGQSFPILWSMIGSALFVAWSQARDAGDPVSPFQLRRDVKRLFGERPTNAMLVKVSYWLGL